MILAGWAQIFTEQANLRMQNAESRFLAKSFPTKLRIKGNCLPYSIAAVQSSSSMFRNCGFEKVSFLRLRWTSVEYWHCDCATSLLGLRFHFGTMVKE